MPVWAVGWQERNPEIREPKSFIIDYKQTCPPFTPEADIIFIILDNKSAFFPGGRRYLYLLRLFTGIITLESIVWNKGSQCLYQQVYRNGRQPGKIASLSSTGASWHDLWNKLFVFGSLSLSLPLGETLQDWEDDTKWAVMDFWCGSHFSRPVL